MIKMCLPYRKFNKTHKDEIVEELNELKAKIHGKEQQNLPYKPSRSLRSPGICPELEELAIKLRNNSIY
jgi:hypothetical protein